MAQDLAHLPGAWPSAASAAERQKAGIGFAVTALAMSELSAVSGFPSRTEQLLGRARRAQQRGEVRQALVALREAAMLAETDPRLWALYGAACAKAHRLEEAQRAFSQALYFRQSAHDLPRANSLRAAIRRLGLVSQVRTCT